MLFKVCVGCYLVLFVISSYITSTYQTTLPPTKFIINKHNTISPTTYKYVHVCVMHHFVRTCKRSRQIRVGLADKTGWYSFVLFSVSRINSCFCIYFCIYLYWYYIYKYLLLLPDKEFFLTLNCARDGKLFIFDL